MQIETERLFRPITVTLDSQAEVQLLVNMLGPSFPSRQSQELIGQGYEQGEAEGATTEATKLYMFLSKSLE